MNDPSPQPKDGQAAPGERDARGAPEEEVVRFARRTAHDLNNAIQVASMNLFLLRTEVGDEGEAGELIEEMTEALERASHLASELGRFAKEAAPSLGSGPRRGTASDGSAP